MSTLGSSWCKTFKWECQVIEHTKCSLGTQDTVTQLLAGFLLILLPYIVCTYNPNILSLSAITTEAAFPPGGNRTFGLVELADRESSSVGSTRLSSIMGTSMHSCAGGGAPPGKTTVSVVAV